MKVIHEVAPGIFYEFQSGKSFLSYIIGRLIGTLVGIGLVIWFFMTL